MGSTSPGDAVPTSLPAPSLWFEGVVDPDGDDYSVEDQGAAHVVELHEPGSENEDFGVFVRLHSWDERAWAGDPDAHEVLRSLRGRRVRLVLEVLD